MQHATRHAGTPRMVTAKPNPERPGASGILYVRQSVQTSLGLTKAPLFDQTHDMHDWIADPKGIITMIVTILGIGYIGWWVGRVKSDQGSFENFMKVVRADVKEINSRPEPALTETDSPAQLAEFGVEIADLLQARDWARQVAPGLLADIRDKEPFEIEEGPAETVDTSFLDRDWQRKVRRTSSELGVDTDSVLLVMRIVLKDELTRLASEGAFEDGWIAH